MTDLAIANNSPKGPVTILGNAFIGETLIARPNGIGDIDGINIDTASYQWLRDGETILGATSQTYSVTSEDLGAQISITYSYTDLLGTQESVTSDPESAVPAEGTPIPEDTAPLNPLLILGDAIVGETLTARPNAVTDANGIDYASATFQWLRDGEFIAGATAQRYDVTEADAGAEISVKYLYLDLFGNSKIVISNPKPETVFPNGENTQQSTSTDGDVLEGTADADALIATQGLARIDGLGDVDTAFFAGDQTSYTITLGRAGVSVTDRSEGGLGTIALDNVDLIDFGTELAVFGGPIDLQNFGAHTDISAQDLESLIELYIAYFNRAPDAVGLNFWGSAFANGTTFQEMATLFGAQDETRATYDSTQSSADFVTAVYDNVLGRVPDQAGLDFWVEVLDSGALASDQFILEVLNGTKASAPADASAEFIAQLQADQTYISDKTDIGAYFSVHKGMSDVSNAVAALALFDGTQAGIDNAVDAIDAFHQDAIDGSNGEFLLTLVGVIDDPFAIA